VLLFSATFEEPVQSHFGALQKTGLCFFLCIVPNETESGRINLCNGRREVNIFVKEIHWVEEIFLQTKGNDGLLLH
jgi:hypothetical protein